MRRFLLLFSLDLAFRRAGSSAVVGFRTDRKGFVGSMCSTQLLPWSRGAACACVSWPEAHPSPSCYCRKNGGKDDSRWDCERLPGLWQSLGLLGLLSDPLLQALQHGCGPSHPRLPQMRLGTCSYDSTLKPLQVRQWTQTRRRRPWVWSVCVCVYVCVRRLEQLQRLPGPQPVLRLRPPWPGAP